MLKVLIKLISDSPSQEQSLPFLISFAQISLPTICVEPIFLHGYNFLIQLYSQQLISLKCKPAILLIYSRITIVQYEYQTLKRDLNSLVRLKHCLKLQSILIMVKESQKTLIKCYWPRNLKISPWVKYCIYHPTIHSQRHTCSVSAKYKKRELLISWLAGANQLETDIFLITI